MSKVDYTQFRTIRELNAMFDAEEVAKKLIKKVSLEKQRIERRPKKTPAEFRRLKMIQDVKSGIERDRGAIRNG